MIGQTLRIWKLPVHPWLDAASWPSCLIIQIRLDATQLNVKAIGSEAAHKRKRVRLKKFDRFRWKTKRSLYHLGSRASKSVYAKYRVEMAFGLYSLFDYLVFDSADQFFFNPLSILYNHRGFSYNSWTSEWWLQFQTICWCDWMCDWYITRSPRADRFLIPCFDHFNYDKAKFQKSCSFKILCSLVFCLCWYARNIEHTTIVASCWSNAFKSFSVALF